MYKKHVCVTVTGVCYFVIYHRRYAVLAIYKSMNIYSLQRPKTDTLENQTKSKEYEKHQRKAEK